MSQRTVTTTAPGAKVFASFNVPGLKPTDTIPHKRGAFEVEVARHNYVIVTCQASDD